MGCSFAGLVAIIVVAAGMAINVTTTFLPLWSASSFKSSLDQQQVSIDFTAGIWGYCTNLKADGDDQDAGSILDHCFLWHTSSKVDFEDIKDSEIDEKLAKKLSEKSVCDAWGDADKLGAVGRKAFATPLALLAGLDASGFESFVKNSCSFLGTAEYLVVVLGALTSIATFVLLVLGITCCKKQSSFNGFVKVLVVITFVAEVLAFALWLVQAHPINKLNNVSLNVSFYFTVVSAFLFMISIVLVQRHISMHSTN